MTRKVKALSRVTSYQVFVSLINESVVKDSQALIPPDTHKLGHRQKSDGGRHQGKKRWIRFISGKGQMITITSARSHLSGLVRTIPLKTLDRSLRLKM